MKTGAKQACENDSIAHSNFSCEGLAKILNGAVDLLSFGKREIVKTKKS